MEFMLAFFLVTRFVTNCYYSFSSNRGTLIPLVLYMVFSFGVIGYNEIFSLWASTQPYHGKSFPRVIVHYRSRLIMNIIVTL